MLLRLAAVSVSPPQYAAMNSFNTIAAVCGIQAGEEAQAVANIEVFVEKHCDPSLSLNAPLALERFGLANSSPLFRIVAFHSSEALSTRNKMALCLPSDTVWKVSVLRKIKAKRSGKRAIEFEVLLPPGNREGYDVIKITIPFDGNNGKAVLYYQALVFASQEVHRIVSGV